jgi:hypothetical protein
MTTKGRASFAGLIASYSSLCGPFDIVLMNPWVSMRSALGVTLVAVMFAGCVCAQEPGAAQGVEPLPTLRIGTKIVSVAAFIRDKQGRPVGGVTAEDLVLKQDGQPQPIRYFSQGAELPLTMDLMVDTSGSQRLVIADEAAASMVFFRAMLGRKEDRAALIQFDVNVLELQPLTSDVENLQRSLNYLSYPHAPAAKNPRATTMLYDAVCEVAPKMAAEQGRKAMLILSDGEDFGRRRMWWFIRSITAPAEGRLGWGGRARGATARRWRSLRARLAARSSTRGKGCRCGRSMSGLGSSFGWSICWGTVRRIQRRGVITRSN